MKSISSQLNRGTELLKQTVQRAIFSKVPASLSEQQLQQPPTTAKPTPYHCDPHAVTRSSSVDSLHLETCHIRPIRPYSLTPFRRGNFLSCPVVVRPDEEEVIKFNPIKVKARFKLQKGPEKSAFCSLGSVTEEISSAKAKQSPKKSVGRGAKRKRSVPDDPEDESPDTPSPVKRRGKRGAGSRNKSVPEKAKTELKKTPTKASAKHKSTEQAKQEREDFELAKRLQKELNSSNESNGAVNGTTTTRRTRNGRSLNNNSVVSASYSLRTTRSLSKFSLASVSPTLALEEEPPEQQHKENVKKPVAVKKSSPTKNGLTTRNNITGRGRKRILKEEKEEEEKKAAQPPPEISTTTKRTTRSKGSCRSTK